MSNVDLCGGFVGQTSDASAVFFLEFYQAMRGCALGGLLATTVDVEMRVLIESELADCRFENSQFGPADRTAMARVFEHYSVQMFGLAGANNAANCSQLKSAFDDIGGGD